MLYTVVRASIGVVKNLLNEFQCGRLSVSGGQDEPKTATTKNNITKAHYVVLANRPALNIGYDIGAMGIAFA